MGKVSARVPSLAEPGRQNFDGNGILPISSRKYLLENGDPMVNGSMAGFGEELRRARSERGVSLESISNLTKIAVRHLESLEQERFKDLPGGVFNRSMVRSYARAIGLDEQEWHDRFMESYRRSGALKHDDADWIAFTESTLNPDQSADPAVKLRWAGVVVMGLIFLLLAAVAWYLLSRRF